MLQHWNRDTLKVSNYILLRDVYLDIYYRVSKEAAPKASNWGKGQEEVPHFITPSVHHGLSQGLRKFFKIRCC